MSLIQGLSPAFFPSLLSCSHSLWHKGSVLRSESLLEFLDLCAWLPVKHLVTSSLVWQSKTPASYSASDAVPGSTILSSCLRVSAWSRTCVALQRRAQGRPPGSLFPGSVPSSLHAFSLLIAFPPLLDRWLSWEPPEPPPFLFLVSVSLGFCCRISDFNT